MCEYPVEHICPSLHSDALKNCQHGKENVVKVCDPTIGTLPLAPALSPVGDTKTAVPGKRTGWRIILHHEPCRGNHEAHRHWVNKFRKHQTCVKSEKRDTCGCVIARLVHPADEKLQSDDGVDYDDEHDKHTNVEEGNHGFHDGVQHNLQTWQSKYTLYMVQLGWKQEKNKKQPQKWA